MLSQSKDDTMIIALLLKFDKWTEEEGGLIVNVSTLKNKLENKRFDYI